MNSLLVVEDEVLTAEMLTRYFEKAGYEVLTAQTGADAVRKAVYYQPQVVILDIMLPDTDGYTVCKKLRGDARTSSIPVIFLTQKDSRSDRIDGLELGADDYLTKPFDVEELRLRVQMILNRLGETGSKPLVDPATSLPNVELMTERLPELLDERETVFVDVQIRHHAEYTAKYGAAAADQVVKTTAKLIGDLLQQVDPDRSLLGHPRVDHFLIGLPWRALERLQTQLPSRFDELVARFYDYPDQQRGRMWHEAGDVPFMSLAIMRVKAGALRVLVAQHQRRHRGGRIVRLAAEARTLRGTARQPGGRGYYPGGTGSSSSS